MQPVLTCFTRGFSRVAMSLGLLTHEGVCRSSQPDQAYYGQIEEGRLCGTAGTISIVNLF